MSLKPESIKICCYNVLADCWVKPCKPMFLGCWEKRKVELVNRLDNLKADVMCLQEVDRFNDLAQLMFERGYIGYRVKDRDVSIFYRTDRFKVLKVEELHYTDHLARSALLLKLESLKGAAFNVISTHVTWISGYDVKQMEQLQKFVHLQKGAPTILCGDLNATPEWGPIDTLCKTGFRDTLKSSSKKTYIDQGRRLDYILASKGIHVKFSDVVGEVKKLTTAEEPSDHLPIMAELIIASGLKTLNKRSPGTIDYKLVEALNQKMKLQAHTQEYYNTVADTFHLLLGAVAKEGHENFLEKLISKLDSENMKGVKPVICGAICRYEHSCLQEIISFLQKGETQEALDQFSQLTQALRGQVYFAVYEVERMNGRTISHSNFGEVAFHRKDNLDVSNDVRIKAIERFLLREVYQLLKNEGENEAMPLFEVLSADPIRNTIYGEIYALGQKRGFKIEHSDFGKMAFHRLDNCDAPNDLRLDAMQSYFSKTGI